MRWLWLPLGLPLPAQIPRSALGRDAKWHPAGLSGCSCWRKLPVEFGGCGELQPRVSNVNKEESDQAGQIFRRRMALQQEGGGRNSWAWFRGWEGRISRPGQRLANSLGVRERLGPQESLGWVLFILPLTFLPVNYIPHTTQKTSFLKHEQFDS